MARRGIRRFAVYDTSASRAIAWSGVGLTVIGVVGSIVAPDLLLLWVVLIGFGVATVPRAALEWWRERRKPRL